MFQSIVNCLISRAQRAPWMRMDNADGKERLGRYWLTKPRVGFVVCLHNLTAADSSPYLHDHPFPWWFSMVLRGGYWEKRPTIAHRQEFGPFGVEPTWTRLRRVGSVVFRRYYHRHSVAAVMPNTWTLFIMSTKKAQAWGYYTPQGWMKWTEYEEGRDLPVMISPATSSDSNRNL